MKPALSSRKLLLFSALSILLLASIIFGYFSSSQVNIKMDQVIESHEVLNKIQSIKTNISNSQKSQRGYLITGRPEMLENYTRSQENVLHDYFDLKKLRQGNKEVEIKLNSINQPLIDFYRTMSNTILLNDTGNPPAAMEAVKSGKDDELMNNIIVQLIEVTSTEDQLLKESTAQMVWARTINFWSSLFSYLITISIGLIIIGRYFLIPSPTAAEQKTLSV
jgi:CHASE3 domain sensor protein